MSLPTITPEQAKKLLDKGAILVDVREPKEHARESIPGAQLLPLSQLDEMEIARQNGQPVIFHCKSGMRTSSSAGQLARKVDGNCKAFIIEGGINAWKRAGLPVASQPREPLSPQRQVQIVAGSIALLGLLLGFFASPLFFAVPLLMGASLMIGRSAGTCPLVCMLTRPRDRQDDGPKDRQETV